MTRPDNEQVRGDVSIAGLRGTKVARNAVLLPSLAVHRSFNFARGWAITHRATGCAIGHARDEELAIKSACEIERDHSAAMTLLNALPFAYQGAAALKRRKIIKRLVADLEAKGLR